jgi:hypothetical protein
MISRTIWQLSRTILDPVPRRVIEAGVAEPNTDTRLVDVAELGERLSALRLCDRAALAAMRRSLEEHGQLTTVVVFHQDRQLQVIDGFKRMRAAQALGSRTLAARVVDVGSVGAKLRLRELHDGRGMTELEEAWRVRSLYREDRLSQPDIARLLPGTRAGCGDA